MSVPGIPNPTVRFTSDDQTIAQGWYRYLKAADATWRPYLQVISTGTTANTLIPNRGVTLIQTSPPTTHTLADPEPGVEKTIIVQSASTTGRVTLGSTTDQFLPGTGWVLAFATSAANKVVKLIGVSTSQYYIVSNPGSVTVTTV